MRGYDDASYGDGFADVYDEWYDGLSDVGATIATLLALAGGAPVLELGVGTGRLAVPLAEAGEASGVEVHGVDTSTAMLAQLAAKAGGHRVRVVHGDMVDGLPAGPFGLVFVAYNTFFNLLTEERQRACVAAVATRLPPAGIFLVEAFVPEDGVAAASGVTVRSVTADRVVLAVSTSDPARQTAEGQYVDITEAGGVRLRPWSIRWATPEQLDAMATAAGLELIERWAGFDREPFTADSTRHVSVYRRPV